MPACESPLRQMRPPVAALSVEVAGLVTDVNNAVRNGRRRMHPVAGGRGPERLSGDGIERVDLMIVPRTDKDPSVGHRGR
jgi:hypothetical protein